MTEARERRRERAESKKKTDVMGTIKKLRVPIVILILWAAIIGFNVAQAQGLVGDNAENCPGHWHSAVDIYVDGQRVAFPQGPYQLGGKMSISAHMHGPDDRSWHWEPTSVKCIDFKDALSNVDVDISSAGITLDGTQSITGTFRNNETHEWQTFSGKWEEGWQSASLSGVANRQLLDGERVAFFYGPIGADHTAVRDGLGPTAQGVSGEVTGDPALFLAITMTSIFAIIALLIWYNFAKKTW